MHRYIIRRVILNIPVLILVALVTFILMRMVPGDAVTQMLEETGNYSQDKLDKIRQELGLADPVPIQFVNWIGGIARGDWGDSFWTGESSWSRFWRGATITFQLSLMAFGFSIIIGIPIGIFSAIRQDTIPDYIGRLIAIAGISMPDFWLGTMAVLFPAIWWQYQAPVGYMEFWVDPWANFQQFIIPAVIMGFRGAAGDMRLTRSQMLEVLRQDYIRTARSKGLAERTIIFRHALRNAIIPVVTLWGGNLARILGGTIIMEQLFTLPGVGNLTFSAILLRDYAQVQTNVMILAFFVVFGNLITDISYAFIDPRIRYT